MRSLRNLTGSHVELGRDSCAHGSSRRAWVDQEGRINPCLRLARLRHGHARFEHEGRHVEKFFIHEEKSDRVHRHGPAFPCQLVSHSPTHWITQEALLDMIDAIDADMHARAGDAELAPWLLLLDCRAFKNSIRQEVAKHFAEFFLEVESNFERVNLDSSTSVLRQLLLSFVHSSRTERRQPATSNRWLALRRLERGGAA